MRPLQTSVIAYQGRENYQQNAIDLLLLGLKNDGFILAEGERPDSLIAFKSGSFAMIKRNDLINLRITEGEIFDCGYDRDFFFEKVEAVLTK